MNLQQGIDKADIAILSMLYDQEKFSPMYSWQIKNFLADESFLANFNSSISYNTLVRRLKKLCECEYIDRGYKDRNAQTYFLTKTGIEFIENELMENGVIEEDTNTDIEGGN